MDFRKPKVKSLLIVLFIGLGVIFGCNKSSNSSNNAPVYKQQIALGEVSSPDCLNVEKFFGAVGRLYPAPLIRHITQNVTLTSDKSIPHNFLLRVQYGNFYFEDVEREAIHDLVLAEQKDCSTVVLKTVGGDIEEFKITDAKPDSLSFENESGEKYVYQWLTAQSFKVKSTYQTGDFLCDQKSQISVTVESFYSWEPDFMAQKFLPKDFISTDYLQNIAEATGQSADIIYNTEVETKTLSVEALRKFGIQPAKDGLGNCE